MRLTREMKAYIVLLHLLSQKWMNLGDMIKLFGWKHYQRGDAQETVGHVNNKIKGLSEEWGEDIPHINAFAFKNNGDCTAYICENIFETQEWPTPQQIAKYAYRIVSYDKWDKVVEVFREAAFRD